MSGILWLVATPIGNLEDLSPRAAQALCDADLILCEDTRHSEKLLSRVGARGRRMAFHDHNEARESPEIVARLKEGLNVALISDAGTPALSDPGYPLVTEALAAGVRVSPLPGPSAVVTALCASGLPPYPFTFYGFPPEIAGRRARLFERASEIEHTLVFYLSPHKAALHLEDAARIFGPRPACLAREMTKIFEEFIRAPLPELAARFQTEPIKGELVLIVGPAPEPERADEEEIGRAIEEMRSEGLKGRALREALVDRFGLSKREAYALALGRSPEADEPAD